jgi:hypothetical protein
MRQLGESDRLRLASRQTPAVGIEHRHRADGRGQGNTTLQ